MPLICKCQECGKLFDCEQCDVEGEQVCRLCPTCWAAEFDVVWARRQA